MLHRLQHFREHHTSKKTERPGATAPDRPPPFVITGNRFSRNKKKGCRKVGRSFCHEYKTPSGLAKAIGDDRKRNGSRTECEGRVRDLSIQPMNNTLAQVGKKKHVVQRKMQVECMINN